MAAGSTYTPLATTTLSSTTATVTLSSIPGTYTDLVLVCNMQRSGAGFDVYLQFNGDTASNYSWTVLTGNGTTASSARIPNYGGVSLDYYGTPPASPDFGIDIVNILNYANTTTYKTLLSRANTASSGIDALVGLWRSTSAITSIVIYGGTFNTGSTFTLYGIAAA